MFRSRLLPALGVLSLLAIGASFFTGLLLSPTDGLMGEVQRIMYVHVPAAWVAFLAFFIVFGASILYLLRHEERWDRIARSAAELGVVFMALAIALGAIWGKPTWGVWWTWDPRLTTSALLLVIYLGYLALRGFIDDPERRARVAAAVGIIGFLDVPIVYLSVLWWRTLHQQPSTPETVARPMMLALWLSVAAFTLLFTFFLVVRVRIAELNDRHDWMEAHHA